VQLVTGALFDDGHGYVIGRIEVECRAEVGAACERLVDAYHSRLDVFEVVPCEPCEDGGCRRLLVGVQCTAADARHVWELLEERLRSEQDLSLSGRRPAALHG